jgi:hypothetical protein
MEGDTLIIRASAIGHPCLWELIAAGQGELMGPIPTTLQRAFDEGNLLEPVIIKRLEKDHGVVFESHQSEGELYLSENVAIRYHSDGIGSTTNERHVVTKVVVEAKALSDALWQEAKRNGVGSVIDEYPWQLSVMMEGEQLPGLWAAYNKGLPPDDNGVRQDCADMGKILLELVDEPPISMVEIQLKASLIKEGVFGEPIISSDRPCDSPNHWPCRYLAIRPEPEGTVPSKEIYVPEGDDKANIDYLIKEFITHKGMAEESTRKFEAARDEIVRLAGKAAYVQTDKYYFPISQGKSGGKIAWDEMSEELKAAIDMYRRPGRKYKYLVRKSIKRLGL